MSSKKKLKSPCPFANSKKPGEETFKEEKAFEFIR